MINTRNDLLAYSKRRSKQFPGLEPEFDLSGTTCTDADLVALRKALPGLPESYLRATRVYRLDGVSIGYFQLAPGQGGGPSFRSQLVDVNTSRDNPFLAPLRSDNAWQVGWFEADPIAVCAPHGRVIKYDESSPSAPPVAMAPSFEMMLFLAATLDDARERHENSGGIGTGWPEFERAIIEIAGDKEAVLIREAWRTIATIVLP